jgi:hypothetical protein
MAKDLRCFRRGCLQALIWGVAVFVFAGRAAAQNATFNAQSYPPLGNAHTAVDLNGDGRLDLAGAGFLAASVMLNNGGGTFQPRVDYSVAGPTQGIAAGDFNGDGKRDLVVTINNQQIGLAVLLGNGDGTFGAPRHFPNTSGFDSPSVAAVDLNKDGKLDIIVMHSIACYTAPCVAATTLTEMLGNGDGTFQPARELPGGEFMHVMNVGDFNRDGIVDLAIGGENTRLFIQLGLGDGTFNRLPPMSLVPGGDLFSACNDVDVADFNRDAIQDLVVPLGNGQGNVILLGNGDGTFRQSFRILENAVNAPYNLAVADYNGDGFLDIARAMANGDSGLVEIAHGNGDGTFKPVVRYLVPAPQSSLGGIFILASEFNGDGRPDIALTVGGANHSLYVLINTTGTTTPTATVSAVTLSPSTVTGGGTSTGTVTLSARAPTATTVRLSSNNGAATVPTSVTVERDQSSATFTVNTSQVSAPTTATLTATLGSSSRAANLTINPPTSTVDTVSITRAEYESSKRTLRVEATSTRSTATLQVFVTSTNQLIGTLTNNGGGKYSGQFSLASNPQSITVRSNFGGQATRTVTVK